jgi:copper chaperone CopZ
MKETMFIQNVKCGGCAHTIKTKIEGIENVSNVEITIEEGVLTFECDTLETMEFVKKTLKNIGYPEQGQENTLGSKAKSYVSCAIGKMNS